MAKLSSINKNNKRIKLSDRLFKKRQKLAQNSSKLIKNDQKWTKLSEN